MIKILVVLLALVSFGRPIQNVDPAHFESEEITGAQRRQEHADSLVSGLEYIKDPRTNLCFAYLWAGLSKSPSLEILPCEKVPSDLLVVGNPSSP